MGRGENETWEKARLDVPEWVGEKSGFVNILLGSEERHIGRDGITAPSPRSTRAVRGCDPEPCRIPYFSLAALGLVLDWRSG